MAPDFSAMPRPTIASLLNLRAFARLSVVAAAAPLMGAAANKPPIIKPKRLAPGDTVGLVLPATAAFEADEIQFAKEQMEAIGFKVVIGAHAFDKWGYFAGRDKDRADDINRMFADDTVNSVVRSEEHTSELQSRGHLVCRLLLEKKK